MFDRRVIAATAALLVLGASGAQSPSPSVSGDARIAEARGEEDAARKEADRLQALALKARTRFDRLSAERAAAIEAIAVAEARITASQAELDSASEKLALYRRLLAERQAPVASLVAGLAMMAQRPPILALLDHGSADDIVRTKVLLDWTMPAIRARTANLSRQIANGSRLEQVAAARRAALLADRQELKIRQARLARLESEAYDEALTSGSAALSASDRVIAADSAGSTNGDSGSQIAGELLAQDPIPLENRGPDGVGWPAFDYALPADAPVRRGVGDVDRGGIRSRGLLLATARGTLIRAPADGVVRYSGPFRNYDGIILIDHGGGWVSVIVNVGPTASVGDRITRGTVIARALGPVEVELSDRGRYVSPALIAGSSGRLSKGDKGR